MSYEVGSGQLMEGLDDAVRGLSADESKTFQTALLSGPNAGESADVTVTVRSVKAKELPELDDEFAQTASEFDTLAELRDDVRTRLARTKTLQQGAQARDKLVEHLIEVVEVPMPENLVEREIEWRNRAFEQELQQAGMDWDSFLSISGVENREAYDADQRKTVEEAVRTQFILDAIADAREVTVDNDDLSAQIMAQAQRSRMSPEQYAQQLQQGGNIAEFVADVRRTKTLAQLLEQTTITDASGNVVDLEALRPQTVQAPAADDADDRRRRRSPPRPPPSRRSRAPPRTPRTSRRPEPPRSTADAVPSRSGWGGVVVFRVTRRCAVGEHRPDGDCASGVRVRVDRTQAIAGGYRLPEGRSGPHHRPPAHRDRLHRQSYGGHRTREHHPPEPRRAHRCCAAPAE